MVVGTMKRIHVTMMYYMTELFYSITSIIGNTME